MLNPPARPTPTNALQLLLCLTFALVMHIPSTNIGGSGFLLHFNTFVLALFVPGLFLLLTAHLKDPNLEVNRVLWTLAALALLLALPLFGTEDLDDVRWRIAGLWLGVLFYLVLLQNDRLGRETVLALIVFSALLQSLYGLLQLFWLYDSGWIPFEESRRPSGVFQQVNVLASYVATGLIAAGWLAVNSQRRLYQYLAFVMALIGPTLLFLILSRAAFLGLAVALIMLALFHWRARAEVTLGRWWASLAAGGVIGALVLVARATSGEAARSATSFASGGVRVYDYAHSLWMLLQKPWVGWGYGNFDSAFLYSWAERRLSGDDIGLISRQMHHPHNELLLWGIEGGLALVAAIVLVAVLLIVWAARAQGRRAWLNLALVAPIAVHAMLELPFYHSIVHWLAFILLLWVALDGATAMRRVALPFSGAVRVLSAVFAAASLVFFATAYHTSVIINQVYASQGFSGDRLEKVINPFVLGDYLDLALTAQRLEAALGFGEPDFIEPVMGEVEAYLARDPNRSLLVRSIIAYNRIGDTESARRNLALGLATYEGIYPFDEQRSLSEFRLPERSAPGRVSPPGSTSRGAD